MTAPSPILNATGSMPARKALAIDALRTYVAGDLSGPNKHFRPRLQSADAEIRRGLRTIIGRCRDQAINNPSIRGAINRIVNNAVRDGIGPQFRFLGRDNKLDTEANKNWLRLFYRWANYAGLNGRLSLWRIERLCLAQMWSDGELYVHRTWDDAIPGIPSLRLELLERDQLDTSVDGELKNGNLARAGKELDQRTGRIVAYHFFRTHPGEYLWLRRRGETVRIQADDIIDVHEPARISQTMGVPWLAAVVMEAYDLEDYRAYERIGAKVAAAFGVFLRSTYPDITLPSPGIGIPPGAEINDGRSSWPMQWQPGSQQFDLDYIDPGRIQTLPYGTDITIASHNRPGTQYEPYVKESRRTQSTGLGISYEAFANDYTDSSYASARSGALEERLSYQGMQFFLDEALLTPLCRWFIEAAWLAGLNPHPMPGFAADPYPYYESLVQLGPGWSWVDPLNDARASTMKIENCLSSHQREMAPQGTDFRDVLEELIEEETMKRELLRIRADNLRLQREIDHG